MTTRGHAFQIRYDDLTDAAKDLEGLEKVTGPAITKGLKRFTGELRERSESKGRGLGGVHRHAVSQGGIEEFQLAKASGIRLAASRSPTILGAEYGAKAYPQFPTWRGNQFNPSASGVGYMMHPALREYLPKGEDKLADLVFDAIKKEVEAT